MWLERLDQLNRWIFSTFWKPVHEAKNWHPPLSTLEYRPSSLLWIFAFPVVATAVLAAVLVKLDAAKPQGDDLHCDANSPEWVRFLGYAGVSVVIACPAFFIAVATAYRLIRTHFTNRTNYLNSLQTRSAQMSGVASGVPVKAPHYKLARTTSPPPVNSTSSASLYGSNFAIPSSPIGRGNLSMPSSPMNGVRPLPPSSPMFQAGRALSVRSVSDYPDEVSVYDGTKPPLSPTGSYPAFHIPFGRRPAPELTQSERDAFSEAGYNMDAPEKIPESVEEEEGGSSKNSTKDENRPPAIRVHQSFVQSQTGGLWLLIEYLPHIITIILNSALK